MYSWYSPELVSISSFRQEIMHPHTVIDNQKSTETSLDFGVSQGSVLGPVLVCQGSVLSPVLVFLNVLCWALYWCFSTFCAGPCTVIFVSITYMPHQKALYLPWNVRKQHTTQTLLSHLKIAQTWSICFTIGSKILSYGWKTANSKWIILRLKLFTSHHLLILSLLESSALFALSATVIFQWNNMSSKRVGLNASKSDEEFHSPISNWRHNQDTS